MNGFNVKWEVDPREVVLLMNQEVPEHSDRFTIVW